MAKGDQNLRRTITKTQLQRDQNETKKTIYDVDQLQNVLRYGTTKLDITLSKMYKIPNEYIKFIEKTMETWKSGIDSRKKMFN